MERSRYHSWDRLIANLQVGDILLIHNVANVSKVVRFLTKSYWSHSGLVFKITHPDSEHRTVMIIEAQDNGIEIHRLGRYIRDLGPRRIGFKRLPGLTGDQREKIRGFFLDTIDTPYDYTRLYRYFISAMLQRLIGVDVLNYMMKHGVTPETFVCSSFVQRAMYLALPPGERDRALFRKDPNSNYMQQLETCSPAEIAKSTNTEWLWNPHM